MIEERFDPEAAWSDFHPREEPELALVRLRTEIERRLRWLEHYLTPEAEGTTRRPGQALADRKLIDAETLEAISRVIEASNPAAHGRTVEPATAAIIVDTGLRLVRFLGNQIEITRRKISGLGREARLVYRLLELPTARRNRIAHGFGVDPVTRGRESRVEQGREVLRRAKESSRLRELWDSVVKATGAEIAANPFEEGT